MNNIKIAILGCGVIGGRRAVNWPKNCQVVACVDPSVGRAQALAEKVGAKAFSSVNEMYSSLKPDIAVIAAINSELVPLARTCLENDTHILIEKPAARSIEELKTLKNPKNKMIKIGFNHRFHPAYARLCKEIQSRPEDVIMYARARYGNGARVGFDKEWRANPELSGGGELLDQGVHVLDLANGLIPDLKVKVGYCKTHFWDMPVDDNAWAILESPLEQTFSMHVSSTEWKNEFQFDVYTRQRRYTWRGLGRSYGPETLSTYTMKPEMGPPIVEDIEFPGDDTSWLLENTNFIDAINLKTNIFGGYKDALNALTQVADIYKSSARLQ